MSESLPSRERGLKLRLFLIAIRRLLSLPSRERGLKYRSKPQPDHPEHVAPFTGAWIEMLAWSYQNADWSVAPFTGAWIEIR